MEKSTWILREKEQSRNAMTAAYHRAMAAVADGKRAVLELRPETRSDAQNARMWVLLEKVSSQVDWYGERLTKEEWKDVFTASLKGQKVVNGIDGGRVVCGMKTSKMTIAEMCDLQTLIEAFCSQSGVDLD